MTTQRKVKMMKIRNQIDRPVRVTGKDFIKIGPINDGVGLTGIVTGLVIGAVISWHMFGWIIRLLMP